ncbi:MAG: imidazole glycerol phosphate synthase subunit HisH [Proteocatella sp.]
MKKVVIVDYGMGNILSVSRACEKLGMMPTITNDREIIRKATHVILPGVGAFPKAMEALDKANAIVVIKEIIENNIPFLGICLGMQMMFESSEENGFTEGLGIIKGKVDRIPLLGTSGEIHKVPYVGWNTIRRDPGLENDPLLKNIPDESSFYFVHSYRGIVKDRAFCYAVTDYDGCNIPAIVRYKNAFGCQFHPEKSGDIGLKLLKNFFCI